MHGLSHKPSVRNMDHSIIKNSLINTNNLLVMSFSAVNNKVIKSQD